MGGLHGLLPLPLRDLWQPLTASLIIKAVSSECFFPSLPNTEGTCQAETLTLFAPPNFPSSHISGGNSYSSMKGSSSFQTGSAWGPHMATHSPRHLCHALGYPSKSPQDPVLRRTDTSTCSTNCTAKLKPVLSLKRLRSGNHISFAVQRKSRAGMQILPEPAVCCCPGKEQVMHCS